VQKQEVHSAERRENLTERIYREVKQRIFDFQLLPGDRFTESEIASLTQASRTPVREALNRLQREGFVEVSFRSGWQVKPFDFAQYEQLYDVRIVLELAAVRRLCEMEPAADLGSLQRIWLVDPEARLANGPELCEIEEGFHCHLVEATGNAELARIHFDVSERLRLVRRIDFTRPPRIDATYEEHARILQSIILRRTEEAQQLLQTHIEESKAEVRKITLHMIFEARQKKDTGEQSLTGSPEEKARRPGRSSP
jgi:DNA-binding GntR family transcriptional regulator